MPEEAEPSDANQQVPRCIEDMLGWAHLGRRIDCRDRTRRYTLFYTSGNENGEGRPRVQLGLRVQGFVQRLNISPFGNWMGTESTATTANQFVAVGPGENGKDAFAAQLQALERVREFVLRLLHQEVVPRTAGGSLLVQRRVFAKVRDGDELEAITSREDPQGRAKELNGKWGIKDRLAIGKLVDGYKIVRCPYITIQRGDFVEMLLEVSVVSGGTKQHVQFNLQQIIRIEEKARDTYKGESAVNIPKQEIRGYRFEEENDTDMRGVAGSSANAGGSM
ncbi:hypothetical protein NLI96_g3329 [Meripilus lineatus]|uniref:Uncharacterized protein n=1 Tax=Meripilus lineatus TaxID=2056292 RepID=A0AAD5V6L9_9APHY|nr:hypothetical protein NLI96_g3329 [Physisporinus lineatus]